MSFRADVARLGAMAQVASLIDQLSYASPTFRAMWQDNDVADIVHAVKDLRHTVLETVGFECSTFGADGRQDLTMIVFLPASTDIVERIQRLLRVPIETPVEPSSFGHCYTEGHLT